MAFSKSLYVEEVFSSGDGIETVLLVESVRSTNVDYVDVGVVVDALVGWVNNWDRGDGCEVLGDEGVSFFK